LGGRSNQFKMMRLRLGGDSLRGDHLVFQRIE
jgi:hypothetical protein